VWQENHHLGYYFSAIRAQGEPRDEKTPGKRSGPVEIFLVLGVIGITRQPAYLNLIFKSYPKSDQLREEAQCSTFSLVPT
jgi:hypothetical protein